MNGKHDHSDVIVEGALVSSSGEEEVEGHQEEEEEEEEEISGSSSSIDLAPKLQEKFTNLSSVLHDTNENLLSFEFMLRQYRQLARIKPLVHSANEQKTGNQGESDSAELLSKSQLAQSAHLDQLLGDLKDAIDKLSSLKSNLNQENVSQDPDGETPRASFTADPVSHERLIREKAVLEERLKVSEERNKFLQERNSFLEQEVMVKTKLCDQLTESAHRSRAALEEERDKCKTLDERLDREKKAAQKVGQDITRYVDEMKRLETELEKVKAKETSLNSNVLSRELQMERDKVKSLETKVFFYEEQIKEYESQLSDLKSGLGVLQKELEEKCRDNEVIFQSDTNLKPNVGSQRQRELEEQLKDLKSKAKVLLRKYNRNKAELQTKTKRMESVRNTLGGILRGILDSDKNYRLILKHLGAEIEASACLLGSFLNISSTKPRIEMKERRLLDWFHEVQPLSTWLRKQLVMLGKYLRKDKHFYEHELKKILVPFPLQGIEDETTASGGFLETSDFSDTDHKEQIASIKQTLSSQEIIAERKIGEIDSLLSNLG